MPLNVVSGKHINEAWMRFLQKAISVRIGRLWFSLKCFITPLMCYKGLVNMAIVQVLKNILVVWREEAKWEQPEILQLLSCAWNSKHMAITCLQGNESPGSSSRKKAVSEETYSVIFTKGFSYLPWIFIFTILIFIFQEHHWFFFQIVDNMTEKDLLTNFIFH